MNQLNYSYDKVEGELSSHAQIRPQGAFKQLGLGWVVVGWWVWVYAGSH